MLLFRDADRLSRGLHAFDVDAINSATAFVADTRGSGETGCMVARATDGGPHCVRAW